MVLPKLKLLDTYPRITLTGATERGRPLYRLLDKFKAIIDGEFFFIPQGFVSDAATIPWGLRNTFPCIDPRYAAAVWWHDWTNAAEIWPRKLCDKLMLAAMIETKNPRRKRILMYSAVRLAGNIVWSKHTNETVTTERALAGISETCRPLYNAFPGGSK